MFFYARSIFPSYPLCLYDQVMKRCPNSLMDFVIGFSKFSLLSYVVFCRSLFVLLFVFFLNIERHRWCYGIKCGWSWIWTHFGWNQRQYNWYISTQHYVVRAWNQDNVSVGSNMSTRWLVSVRLHYENHNKHVCLVQSGHDYHWHWIKISSYNNIAE